MSTFTLRMALVDGFELAIDAQDSLGLASGRPFEPEVLQVLQRRTNHEEPNFHKHSA